MATRVKIFRSDDEIHLERDIQNYLDMVCYNEPKLRLRDIKYTMAVIEKIDVVTYSALLIFDEPDKEEQIKRWRRKTNKAIKKILGDDY